MLEKIAVNLLAGVPAIVEACNHHFILTEAVVKEIIASHLTKWCLHNMRSAMRFIG